MKKMLIFLFFILSIVGCSSETKPVKENVVELPDIYDHTLNYSPEIKNVIFEIMYIFETNPNTKFPVFYFNSKDNSVFKIYYFDSKTGRMWHPSLNIEKDIYDSFYTVEKQISILNLYLTNKKEDPEININHNENIVINIKNYKENEKEILFIFKEYLSFLQKQVNERDLSFKEILKELNSVSN